MFQFPQVAAAHFGSGYVGWVGRVDNSVQDLTGSTITPIDARETFENQVNIYPGSNWPNLQETAWSSAIWLQNIFVDTYAMCWAGNPAMVIPNTTPWSLTGFTQINTNTQKYWLGSFFRFQGKCTQRKAIAWYTDHITHYNFTTPITNDTGSGPCAQGQFAN